MLHQTQMRILQFLVATKLAFVAIFFASFIPASSSFASNEVETCQGTDLVARMQREDPALLEQVQAQAAQVLNGKSIFWKIEKEGVEPSWLLGTMHMTDPSVTKLTGPAEAALEKSRTIIIESTETLDPAKAAASLVQLKHLTFLQSGETLDQLLTADQVTKLETQLTPLGVPLQVAKLLRPWVVATMIGIPACEVQAKRSGMKILDHQIAQHAIDNDKALKGLETTEEQFSAIAGLPRKFHLAALKETLSLGSEEVENMIATMKILYRKGETGMFMSLMKAVSPKAFSGQGIAEFQEALIDRRNRLMAERAETAIQKGNAFIAVGALHLPGETGLVNLLQNKGYSVTPAQ